MLEGLLDALCFIFGCVLWLLASSQFLHKYGSESREVDSIILCVPVIFGPAALLRIFLSMIRRQLYHALFRHGVLLKLEQTPLSRDFLLIWSGLGLILAISAVLRGLFLAVQTGHTSLDVIVTQLLVFISPLYTIVSALLYSLDMESACLKRKCVIELENVGERLSVSTDREVTVLSEHELCAAASTVTSASDFVNLSGNGPAAEGCGLRLSTWDMRWASRLVSQTCREHRMALLLFMPVLAICILALNLTSTLLCIKHRSDMPQLSSLQSTIGELTPPLSPEIREHALYVDIMRRALSIEAGMDDSQTTSLKVSIEGDASPPQESRFQLDSLRSTKVRLHRDGAAYPTTVAIKATTRIEAEHYRLQIVQITTVLRTLMLTGETSNGMKYRRCIFGNWLSHGHLALPKHLQSLRIEITYSNVPYGIPFSSAQADRFSTVYLPMNIPMTPGDCERYCLQESGCFESRISSTSGCFFIFGPRDLTCEQLHVQDDRGQQAPFPLHLLAELCSKSRTACTSFERGSRQHLLLDLLKDNFSNSTASLKTYMNSSGSVFPLKQNDIAFHLGTPPLKTVLVEARQDEMKVSVKTRKIDSGFRFEVVLTYDPTRTAAPWNNSWLNVRLAGIPEDSSFLLQWADGKTAVSSAEQAPFRAGQCDDGFSLHHYRVCGGHFDSPVTTIRVDPWAPTQSVYGILNSTAPWLNQAQTVEVRLTTPDNLEPMQSLIRNSCNIPVCLGGFNECISRWHCNKRNSCFHSCSQEALRNCSRERETGSQFVAVISPKFGTGLLNSYKKLGLTAIAEPEPGMEKHFTREVIKDVAAHCGIKSGMLHLVFHRLRSLQRSPQKAKAMQLFQRLSQNPDFREKQRVLKSPLLAPLKDILPTSWMSLKEVVLYSPEFAQLQYTLCLNAPMPKDTGSILSALLDKVAAADDSKEYEASSRWQHTLSSLIQCMQDKKKTPFPPSSCRSDTGNMDQPSLFHTASTPSTFELLLPLCDTSKPMDATQSSVLHLAAQKNWSESLKAVLKRPGKFIPDINGRRTETLSPPESQYEWVVIENMTPLHAAVRSRCYSCTEDLLHAGAVVNLTVDIVATEGISYVPTGLNRLGYAERDASLHGLSPLHLAAASGCVECIRLLVDAHAPINAESILADQDVSWDGSARQVKDMGNCTLRPLDIALSHCQPCARELLRAGATFEHVVVPVHWSWSDIRKRRNLQASLDMVPNATVRVCQDWFIAEDLAESMRLLASLKSVHSMK